MLRDNKSSSPVSVRGWSRRRVRRSLRSTAPEGGRGGDGGDGGGGLGRQGDEEVRAAGMPQS